MIGILGSFVSLTVCITLPVLCHLKLNGGWKRVKNVDKNVIDSGIQEMSRSEVYFCWALAAAGFILGTIGTVWAVLEPKLEGHGKSEAHSFV